MSWRPCTTSQHLDETLLGPNPSHRALRLTILNYSLKTLNGCLEATAATQAGMTATWCGAYDIAVALKGAGIRNEGTNLAHNLPLMTNPHNDSASVEHFN